MFYKYAGNYSVELLQLHDDKFFVFGDNMKRYGKKGQAIVRDECNAMGIATKFAPSNDSYAFFTDAELPVIITEIVSDLKKINYASQRRSVVVPVTSDGRISLGLGLAKLDVKAPVIYSIIATYLESLAQDKSDRKSVV